MPRHFPGRNRNLGSHKNLDMNVHHGFTHNWYWLRDCMCF